MMHLAEGGYAELKVSVIGEFLNHLRDAYLTKTPWEKLPENL